MSSDLIRSRSRLSPRVRGLSATAIRVALRNRFECVLEQEAAELLARHLTPAEAVDRYQRQVAIRRTGMNESQLQAFRIYTIANEAVRGSGNGETPVDRRDAELLEKIRRNAEYTSGLDTANMERERVLAELRSSGLRFRYFVRKSDRLWRKQRSQLRAAIYDGEECDDAVSELAVLYTEIYREALRMLTIRGL